MGGRTLDATNRELMLKNAASKCTSFQASAEFGGEINPSHAILARSLLLEADRLSAASHMFSDTIKDPEALLIRYVDQKTLKFLEKLDGKLASIVFVTLGNNVLNKLPFAGAPGAKLSAPFVKFLDFVGLRGAEGMLCVGMVAASKKYAVQNHLVVEFIEKCWSMTIDGFMALWRELLADKRVPCQKNNYFTSTTAAPNKFCMQAWLDLSVCSLIYYALLALVHKDKHITPQLATLMCHALDKKDNVSLRLRTFSGKPVRTGDNDVGRYGWKLLDIVKADVHDKESVINRVLPEWAALHEEDTAPLPADPVEFFDTFLKWHDNGRAARILSLAKSIGSVSTGDCGHSNLDEAKIS